MINASKIEKILHTGAAHSLYRKDGKWYHHLNKFPGILFDSKGFLLFNDESDYLNNPLLQHGKDLHIPNGISTISGYKKFTKKQAQEIKSFLAKNVVIDKQIAWSTFLRNAKEYEISNEIFYSPLEGSRYQIVSIENETVKVLRLDVENSSETIGRT